jgi:hypothetical protein
MLGEGGANRIRVNEEVRGRGVPTGSIVSSLVEGGTNRMAVKEGSTDQIGDEDRRHRTTVQTDSTTISAVPGGIHHQRT